MYKEIHTGGDPRNYLEFSEIRNEINKINHPGAPEVDFKNIETLALELFSKNGIDLQTAAYFTFARTKLHGLEGFSEGCELISTLIVNSWPLLWPEGETARIDMLDWLNSRVGQDVRSFSYKTKHIPLLIQIEQPLKAIAEKLKSENLKKTPKIIELYEYIKNTRSTLEKRLIEQRAAKKNAPPKTQEEILIYKPQAVIKEPEPEPVKQETPHVPLVNKQTLVIHKQPRFKGWHGFLLGAAITGAALIGFDHYRNVIAKPEQVNLNFFTPLSSSDIIQFSLQQKTNFVKYDQPQLSDYKNQLKQLSSLSPLATRYYGDNLTRFVGALWPDNAEQKQLVGEWQKQLKMQSTDRFMRNGYYNAQTQLQTLSDDLSRAEEQKRSFTISQLKSAVYNIQTSLNQEPPLEELLRQLSAQENPSPVLIKNIDERFNSLLSYYHELTTAKNE